MSLETENAELIREENGGKGYVITRAGDSTKSGNNRRRAAATATSDHNASPATSAVDTPVPEIPTGRRSRGVVHRPWRQGLVVRRHDCVLLTPSGNRRIPVVPVTGGHPQSRAG